MLYPVMDISDIISAEQTIRPFLVQTPVIFINDLASGHRLFFKLENLQHTGSFKIRGVMNALLRFKEQGKLPQKVVAYGTGNHGLALAWAAEKFGIKDVLIYLHKAVHESKKKMPERYGAKVIIAQTRQEAEDRTHEDIKLGYELIQPSYNDNVTAGAGTVLYEALSQLKGTQLDAAFIPIGGGSLSAGSAVVKHALCPEMKIYAGEPLNANDASISYKTGKLFRFTATPSTIADGATALGIPERLFQYIKLLNGIYEISEDEIVSWGSWFHKTTGYTCEPTSSLAIAAAHAWLKEQPKDFTKQVLIVISGSNV
jgi:threonine dehydratase